MGERHSAGEAQSGTNTEATAGTRLDAAGRAAPVVVTGAAGLVGVQVCHQLAARGWTVRAVVHRPDAALRRLSAIPHQTVVGDIRDPATQDAALRGAGAIIHLAAIAVERGGQSYDAVNSAATGGLLDAARRHGVDRVVFMSQNGAAADARSRFLRSKGLAEALVRASDRQWTVFRPSVIFGEGDAFVTVLAHLARLTPAIVPLPDGGRARFQPVAATDVAHAAAAALEMPDTIGRAYPLGGPEVLTLREMMDRVLEAMGIHRAIVGVPLPLLRPLVAVAQRVLPRPPVTTTLLALLRRDNTVPDSALGQFGIAPTPFTAASIGYVREVTITGAVRSLFAR